MRGSLKTKWVNTSLSLVLTMQCLSSSNFANAQDPGVPNDPTFSSKATPLKLKEFLLAPVPPANGSEAFFDFLAGDDQSSAKVDNIIERDPELMAAAEKGKAFRNFFLASLSEDFRNDSAYFFDPERTLLVWVKELSFSVLKRVAAPINESRASMQAWRDTQAEKHLPDDVELSDVEARRQRDPKAAQAFGYYVRRFNQILQNPQAKDSPQGPSVRQVRAGLVARLVALRRLNFESAMSRVMARPDLPPLYFRVGEKKIKLSISDFKGVNLSFLAPSSHRQIARLEVRHRGGLQIAKTILTKGAQRQDRYYAKMLYSTERSGPTLSSQDIEMRGPHLPGGSLVLRESDFNDILRLTVPRLEDLNSKTRSLDLYLVESSRRDTLITNTIDFISEGIDTNIEGLERRLERRRELTRMAIQTNSKVPLSLTDLIPHEEKFPFNSRLFNSVRWYGYSIHPEHWRIRDATALSLKRGQYYDVISDAPKPPDKKTTLKEWMQARKDKSKEKAEKKRVTQRFTSPSKRLQNAALKSVLYTGLLGGIFFGGKGIVPSSHGFGGASPPQYLGMQYEQGSTNISLSDYEKLSKSPLFSISIRNPDTEIPRYFNLPDMDKIPKETGRFDYDIAKEPPGFAHIFFSGEAGDFSAHTLVQFYTSRGRLPIIVPSGFVPSKLDIQTSDGRDLIEGKDFNLYVNTHSGVFYAKIVPHLDGLLLTYTVGYKPWAVVQHDPSFDNLNLQTLRDRDNELRASGGTELAAHLDNLIQQNKPIGFDDLIRVFRESGYYTFSKEKRLSLSLARDRRFDHFRGSAKFLRKGSYFYMCNGAEELFRTYGNDYAFWVDKNLQIQSISGYVYEPGERYISAAGHIHDIVTRIDKPFTFKELDATPVRMDPKFADKLSSHPLYDPRSQDVESGGEHRKNPKKQDPYRFRFEAVLPEKQKMEPVTDETEDDATQGSNDTKNKTNSSHEHSALATKEGIQILEERIRLTFDVIHASASDHVALQNFKEAALQPGTNLLAAARIIIEYASEEINSAEALKRLIKLEHGLSPYQALSKSQEALIQSEIEALQKTAGGEAQAVHELLARFQSDFNKTISEERKRQQEKISGTAEAGYFSYLLDEKVTWPLRQLSGLLTGQNWSPHTESHDCGAMEF